MLLLKTAAMADASRLLEAVGRPRLSHLSLPWETDYYQQLWPTTLSPSALTISLDSVSVLREPLPPPTAQPVPPVEPPRKMARTRYLKTSKPGKEKIIHEWAKLAKDIEPYTVLGRR